MDNLIKIFKLCGILIVLLTVIFVLTFLYYKLNNSIKQKYFIAIFNLLFFTFISGIFGGLYLISITVFSFLIAKYLENNKSKIVLSFGIILPVIVLLSYKILIKDSIIFTIFGIKQILKIIGISFFTLQIISYIVDVYKGYDSGNYLEVLSFIGYFPVIVSGPILKWHEYVDNTYKIKYNKQKIYDGIFLIAIGMAKKIIVADRLAYAVNIVYEVPLAYSGLSLLLTTFAYTMQLYFDFSGYSDIVIGISKILGIDIKDNFNMPYLSKSFSEFWKRWHISLSSWLTEYIYIPLGGNRNGKIKTYLNIMIVMLLSGFWHGFTLNFILWGLLHGCLLILQKSIFKNFNGILGNFITIILINFLWVPFRLSKFDDIIIVFKNIITLSKGIEYYYIYTIIFLVFFVLYNIYSYKFLNSNKFKITESLDTFKGKLILIAIIMAIIMFGNYTGQTSFIYGNF